jgi:small-conductance mechanosensitive channel
LEGKFANTILVCYIFLRSQSQEEYAVHIQFEKLMIPLALALITTAVLIIARGIFFRLFHRWAGKTESHLDDLIIEPIRIPSLFWCVAMGLYLGINVSDYDGKYLYYISRAIHILLVFSVTLAASHLTGKIFNYYIQKSDIPIPTTGLVNGLLKGGILIVGFIIILNFLGIPITPLLTALGVGGLAVALALQDTLANLFAGIHIMMEKSIRVGDFIKLETGQEGYVEDITWRTTRVRMLLNNMVIIPNHKFSQSIVTNYYLPEKKMFLQIPVSVGYQSDPEKVEAVLGGVAQEAVGEIPGLLGDPEPVVRFIPGFGNSSLDFTLICQVQEFVDQYPVQHELRKRILKKFKEENIEIPYPHRTVYLRQERD